MTIAVNKKQVIRIVGIVTAALLIGLSQLGVLPDLGLSKLILDATGFQVDAAAAVSPNGVKATVSPLADVDTDAGAQ